MDKKTAFFFVNGCLLNNKAVHALIGNNDFVVAVDGGYDHLKNVNLIPDILIGDMDSILPVDLDRLKNQGVETIQFPAEKDESDLELALDHVVSLGFDHITIVAAFGGRLDQTLANLFLITDPRYVDKSIDFFDGIDHVFLINKEIEFSGIIGDRVSLISLFGPTDGVRTRGLKYELDKESLYPERSRGISNEIISEKIKINLDSGRLLCIHTKK